MSRIITLFCSFMFVVALATNLQAQDPRFSQFYAAPLQMNPAMVGVYEGQYRVAVNYRELYSSILSDNAFRSLAASFDARVQFKRGDYFGFGLSALRDEVGVGDLNQTRGSLGASYLKQLGGGYRAADQYLVVGAQLGFAQRSINFRDLWFTNQFNIEQAVIDFSADNGEAFARRTTGMYADISAGLLWYALFDDRQSLYLGAAAYHLNKPDISFLEDQSIALDSRYVIHGGGEIPLTRQFSLMPAALVMSQGKSMSTTAGLNIRYTNRDWREVAVRIGGWAHFSNQLDKGMSMDAIAASAILETGPLNIGLSYDITTSVLAGANNSRGAFEVSLIYTGVEQQRNWVECPNF